MSVKEYKKFRKELKKYMDGKNENLINDVKRKIEVGKLEINSLVELIKMALNDEEMTIQLAGILVITKLKLKEAIDPVMQLLQDPAKNKMIKERAIDFLREIYAYSAIKLLIDIFLHSNDQNLRSSAAFALGWLGTDEAVSPLLNAIKDKTPNFEIAVRTVGIIKLKPATELLLNALKDEKLSNNSRNEIKNALAKLGHVQGSDDFIERLLHGASEKKRVDAAVALGKNKSKTALPALTNALKDKSMEVRLAIVIAIDNIVSSLHEPYQDADFLIRELIKCQKNEEGKYTHIFPERAHQDIIRISNKSIQWLRLIRDKYGKITKFIPK